MSKKRFCKDCKYTKGIGYDFWCGEGHTEYEVFAGETNCPYYKYHDWSKGTPSRTKKQFEVVFNGINFNLRNNETNEEVRLLDEKWYYDYIANLLNTLHDDNRRLQKRIEIHKYDDLDTIKQLERALKNNEKCSKEIEILYEKNQKLKKENKKLKLMLIRKLFIK